MPSSASAPPPRRRWRLAVALAASTALAAQALPSAAAPSDSPGPSTEEPAPVTELAATADATVRDGGYRDDSYGSQNTLQWKVGSAGFTRQTFVSFDIGAIGGRVDAATLRLYGRVSGGAAEEWPDQTQNQVHEVIEDWSEDSITWNTRPAVAPEPATSFVVGGESDQANRWHEIDVTELLTAAAEDDREVLSLRLSRDAETGPIVQMQSRETGNAPTLVVNGAPPEPEPPIEGPVRSALYPQDWHPGMADDAGRFLHDFSHAGYRYGRDVPRGGAGPVLDVTDSRFGADPSGQTDSTVAIQAAIDAAGAAGGGTVQLPAGTFRVSPQDDSRAVLHIPHDDVLLRGAGPGETRIYTGTAEGMRQRAVVLVGPEKTDWQSWHSSEAEQSEPAVPLTEDITEPTRTLHVADTAPFAVGDWVLLKADTTDAWLAEHPVLDSAAWTPTTFRALVYHRQITAVDAEAGTVEIDIPTRYAMLLRDGLRLHHHHAPVTGSGVADLAVGMRQSDLPHSDDNEHNREGTQGYQAHQASVVAFNNAVDGWVDNVHTFRPDANADDVHILSGGVYVWYARSITVAGTDFRNAQYLGAGGNGYHYHLMGSDSLVRDAYAEKGRHNYLVQAVQGTGNVLLDSHSVDATHALELHRHLGAANLFDNVSVDRDTFEMQYRTSGTHAHSGTESVMWNISGERCTRGRLAVSQQFGWGYVIGTTGTGACANVENPGGQHTEPRDWLEYVGAGEHLEPRSLYLDQRERRLASEPAPEEPVVVTPAAVTFTDEDGTEDDSYTVPAVAGVEYLVAGEVVEAGTYRGAGTVTVRARAAEGYVLAEGAPREWTHTFSTAGGDPDPGPEPPARSPEFHLSNDWRGTTHHVFSYGRVGDEVFIGDWDGDGRDTIAVRRENRFHVSNAPRGGAADQVFSYGRAGDVVLVGDWDGDGRDTFAVRRGKEYHVKNRLIGGDADVVVHYGRADDEVLVGDWDGDDRDSFAVRRGSEYHVKNVIAGGPADDVFWYGRAGDVVLAGDWDGNGTDTLAVRRGFTYHVRNTLAGGEADIRIQFGRASDEVFVGDWDGNGTDTLGIRRGGAAPGATALAVAGQVLGELTGA